eukprot:gene446-1087_t
MEGTQVEVRFNAMETELSSQVSLEVNYPLIMVHGTSTGMNRNVVDNTENSILTESRKEISENKPKLDCEEEDNTSYITCQNTSLDHELNWPVSPSGKVKMFAPLKEGKNQILLSSCQAKEIFKELHINYQPNENKRYVKPVYIICEGSDGRFQAPADVDNSIESALQRISFNATLLQTFTAENLNLHGFGRKSFRLERNQDGIVNVNTFISKLHVDKALEMTGDELYRYFKAELDKSELYDPLCKFWAFMSFTSYRPPDDQKTFNEKKIHEYVRGHTALGGGNLALFGTGCLHTWAGNLDELVEKFSDKRKIDIHRLFDDSCDRRYYWANYSTTLGAAIHELGHTFHLPHTSAGIMSRGFDDMNCFFTCQNYPKAVSRTETTNSPYNCFGAHWHRSSAAILNYCRWMDNGADNDGKDEEHSPPIMSLGMDRIGPVGGGNCSNHTKFDLKTWLSESELEFQGLRIQANEYVNAIQFIGRKKDSSSNQTDVVSPWFGNVGKCSDESVREFRLNGENEMLTSIDVRAGEWIDAIRLHSTRKSSVWFGGQGGDLYRLERREPHSHVESIFGTAKELVTSIGLNVFRDNTSELATTTQADKHVYFQSPFGVRVIEVVAGNGEVIKHWEHVDEMPQNVILMSRNDLSFDGKTDTVSIYDGVGGKASYKLANFAN